MAKTYKMDVTLTDSRTIEAGTFEVPDVGKTLIWSGNASSGTMTKSFDITKKYLIVYTPEIINIVFKKYKFFSMVQPFVMGQTTIRQIFVNGMFILPSGTSSEDTESYIYVMGLSTQTETSKDFTANFLAKSKLKTISTIYDRNTPIIINEIWELD